MAWEQQLVSPDQVIHLMRPGMRVFVGTGAAEPRTLVHHLVASRSSKLKDLELIQLASFAETVALDNLQAQKFRLKTFFPAGWPRRPLPPGGWKPPFPNPPIDGNRQNHRGCGIRATIAAGQIRLLQPGCGGGCGPGGHGTGPAAGGRNQSPGSADLW